MMRGWQSVVKVRRCTEGGDAPGWQGATSENTGSILSEKHRSSPRGSPTRQPRWGGGGMQRRPNAAGLSPRAVSMKARVAVLRVSPDTILSDIDRLVGLAGVSSALASGT